jgi:hypothetical protein
LRQKWSLSIANVERSCTIVRSGSEATGWGYHLRTVGKPWDLLCRYI